MKQEIIIFKEEILKEIRDFKENMMKNIDNKLTDLSNKNKELENTIFKISEGNKKLIENLSNRRMNLEKLNEFDSFKNKVDSMLITHEIRINNCIEELGAVRTKYDRALIENLLVPGYIGPSCQFKNLADFIVHNMSEISRIKSEREIMKNSFKDMRVKNDSMMRTILNLTESLVKRCNDYTNSQITEIRKLIYDKLDITEKKESEIQERVNNLEKEQNNVKYNDLEEFKQEFSSNLDEKINELKKTQEESFFNKINKNNSFLENYAKNIIEEKIKEINNNIKEIQNKLMKINNINYPITPQANGEINKNNDNNMFQKLRKGKTNEFGDVNNYIPNKTYSNMKALTYYKSQNKIIKKNIENRNNEIQKNNYDKSLESMLIEEIEKEEKKKKEEKEIPDIVLKHKESKILLLHYNKTQKLKRNTNNLHEIKSGRITGKKFNILNINSPIKKENGSGDSANISFAQKNNDKNEDNIDNSKKIENEINNNKIEYKSIESKEDKLDDNINSINQNDKNQIKKNLITDDNIQNNTQNNIENVIPNENKNNMIKSYDSIKKVGKAVRNIIDELKIPRILEKRILSNDELEELKLKTAKMRNLNNKINFKIDLNKSVSASYKSIKKNIYLSPDHNPAKNELKYLKNWSKNLLNNKSDKNIKLNQEININNSNDRYNLVNLELGQNNYTVNGATVLANKKLVNNHITKNEGPNSFSRLYNAQISKSLYQSENL